MPLEDKFTFVYFPIIVSFVAVILGVRLSNDYINVIITSLSIFVGLLLNLLLLIFDLAKKQKQKNAEYEEKLEILPSIEKVKFLIAKELYVNILFAIVISIFAILACFVATLRPILIIAFFKNLTCFNMIKEMYVFLSTAITITLSLEFLLTLLMILKRFFLIFNKEINE
jgi:hypothetical protein